MTTETHMGAPLAPLLEAISAKAPTPGGGAVAAWIGATGASLGLMVVNYSLGRRAERDQEIRRAGATLENARAVFLELAEEDAAAYERLSEVLKLKKDDPARAERMPDALERAIGVPSAVAATGLNVLRVMHELSQICNPYLRSDLGVAAGSIEASVRGAVWMVRANLPLMADEGAREATRREAEGWLRSAASLRADVDAQCQPRS